MSTIPRSEMGKLGPVVGRANATIFITTAILGFLTWFAISTGTWLTLFILDNLLKLPAALRFPLAIAAVVLTVWTFWKHVVLSMRNKRSNAQVALLLERQYGIDENVVINAIQFEDMKYGERQQDFVQETAKAGSLGLKRIPLSELWQVGRMSVWWIVFAALLALWGAYILVASRYAGNAFFRFANSLSDAELVGTRGA